MQLRRVPKVNVKRSLRIINHAAREKDAWKQRHALDICEPSSLYGGNAEVDLSGKASGSFSGGGRFESLPGRQLS